MNHAINDPFHCIHSNFCAVTELHANGESFVHKWTPVLFSYRLCCSHFIQFWSFRSTLENMQGAPWEVWKHHLAFQSFQHLCELPSRQCILWGWASLLPPWQSSVHLIICFSPGSLDYLSKVGVLGLFPTPNSATGLGRLWKPALRQEDGLLWWWSQFRHIPNVHHRLKCDSNWSFVLTVNLMFCKHCTYFCTRDTFHVSLPCVSVIFSHF